MYKSFLEATASSLGGVQQILSQVWLASQSAQRLLFLVWHVVVNRFELFFLFSVKEQGEKILSRIRECGNTPSIPGKSWLSPNSTGLQMERTAKMYRRKTIWKTCQATFLIVM